MEELVKAIGVLWCAVIIIGALASAMPAAQARHWCLFDSCMAACKQAGGS
jgi:hypothetical protein